MIDVMRRERHLPYVDRFNCNNPRFLEFYRMVAFGMYRVDQGRYRRIKAARYRLVNDWQMEDAR